MGCRDHRWTFVVALLTASSAALGVASAAVAPAPEVPVEATPKATCGPGSRPELGLQGRVSLADHESGRAMQGYTCNTELVGSIVDPTAQGTVGGFKVLRHTDQAGRECAFYDTTLLFPTDVFDAEAGVRAVDMSDPANPVVTATLVTPAMVTPHESLVLSDSGRLVAVAGNPATNVGQIDVYDVDTDCRNPQLVSSLPVGLLGHESGLSPDGNTFYSASPGTSTVQAVALEDLPAMTPVWTSVGEYPSHGLSVSDDGNRIYIAGLDGLHIVDVSQVQARVPFPAASEVARLTWDTMSIPQNALPVTIDDTPYLIEIDEFGSGSKVGAGRIIDISDETKPRIVSNLRLEVHEPEHFDDIAGDPGATNGIQGYAGHYCAVPKRDDPGIVACSMIQSGLRIFDIRNPLAPREIAYFNAPLLDRDIPEPSNFAMSAPAFVPERGEIWYTDGYSGFYALRVTNGVWPFGPDAPAPTTTTTVDAGGDALPATGRRIPTLFAVTTGAGALLLLWAARSGRGPRRFDYHR